MSLRRRRLGPGPLRPVATLPALPAIIPKQSTKRLSESAKFHKVLREAKAGTLRTSAGGRPVSRAQELAIAFSEARRYPHGKP